MEYKKDSLNNQVLTSDQLTLVTSKQVPSKKKKMMIKVVAIFLLSALLVASALEAPGAPSPVDCGDKCGKRCKNAGVKDRCLKYCGICCRECKCVPSGTYGNKHECPCYRDKLSSKGKPKCP